MGLHPCERSFVQGMMAAGALSVRKTAQLFNTCVENGEQQTRLQKVYEDGRGLESVIDRINSYIARHELQLTTAYSPWESDTYWAISNTSADDASRLATDFSSAELSLFYGIVDILLGRDEEHGDDGEDSEERVLTLVDAQNLGPRFKVRVADAGAAIQVFHSRQWLRILRRAGTRAQVVFGARSLLELPQVRAWAMKLAGREESHAHMFTKKEEDERVGSQSQMQSQSQSQTQSQTQQRSSRRAASQTAAATSEVEEEEEDSQAVIRPRRRRAREEQLDSDDSEPVVVRATRSSKRRRRSSRS